MKHSLIYKFSHSQFVHPTFRSSRVVIQSAVERPIGLAPCINLILQSHRIFPQNIRTAWLGEGKHQLNVRVLDPT